MKPNKKRNDANYKKTRNYLTFKLGFEFVTANEIIKRYAEENSIFTTLEKAGDSVQADWNAFMNWWGKVKKDYANKPRDFNKSKPGNEVYNPQNDIKEALRYANGSANDY